jgi:predicted  nucleic acid-binding Zn-ribbon protein
MTSTTASSTWRRAAATAIVIVTGALTIVWAQDTGSTQAIPGGSLAELTAEVRALRAAIQDAAKVQTDTQALGVYLSAQQSRLIQAAARLDAARADTRTSSARATELAQRVASTEADVATVWDVKERAHLTGMLELFKQQRDAAQSEVSRLLIVENDLLAAYNADEARWVDLIGRLEQTIRR